MDKKGFQVSVLASSSSGNAVYIETPKKKILVDAGLTGKKMISLFSEISRNPANLDAILITHEHSDHIKGVGVLARKFQLDVYANEDTWKVIEGKIGKLKSAQKHIFKMGKVKTFGDLDIESFGVSHDAISPQCYAFHKDEKTFVMLTDTGYVSERMCKVICNADVYLMESNHDVQMLRMGAYSWNLKQRILSDKGHLSNEDSAQALVEVLGNKTKRIYLGHLSQENNLRELARMTVEATLKERSLEINEKVKIYDTYAKCATEMFEV
ncbi:MAG: MBL fold metallo-hydrolase [Lactobacillales bacterium]|jgi:phosphoribosyl 1,2-cyclic phosphodiesterase|nr:MBL fold metallo-hydrolase [Lactobacillales bacterium]